MIIELSLMKGLADKNNFYSYRSLLNHKTLSTQSLLLLKDYEAYFEEFESHKEIDFSLFTTYFFSNRHPYMDEKTILEYKEIIANLGQLELTDEIQTLLDGFNKQEFYNRLQAKIEANVDIDTIKEEVDEFYLFKGSNKTTDVDMNLIEALEYTDRSKGLQWRLESLREHFQGGLIKGDFGIAAGYTDSGKTSFLASELSYMAQQLDGDQYILWLNNEGDWKRILPRVYCAALNCTAKDLALHTDKALVKYKTLMKGNSNRIKILDIQGKSTKDIERLAQKNPPSLIVFDMLDHLRGFENYMSSDGGSFERYSKLYHWALALSAEVCPIIATSQLNRNGSNDMYPAITELRGSGVDKQSAATFLLVIGMMTGEDNVRYLSTPKFKISGNKSWKQPVQFDPLKSRFY